MKTTRINTGLYRIQHKDRVFEIENIHTASDGDCAPGWIAYELKGDHRIYLNDYRTKRDAVRYTENAIVEGF